MKSQNEYLKRYISDYATAYYQKVKDGMDEAKIMRMTAYFMNQFSQKLVDDKNKKPNQVLREMFQKEINYDKDLPSRNINLFKNHRFLMMVKSTGLGKHIDADENSKAGPSMETVDIPKIMGASYFRQLEAVRQDNKGVSANNNNNPIKVQSTDMLPRDIVKILYK